MKCPHCGAAVEGRLWFCHHCKRSLPRRTPPRLPRALFLGALAVVVAAAVAVWQGGAGSAQVTAPVPGEPAVQVRAAAGSMPAVPAPQAGARSAVTVVTVPPVRTFVYLNGGSLLGEAPLRNVAIPSGRQTLTLWAPSIGGRATRRVDAGPGETVLVFETMMGKKRFALPRD